MADVTEGNLPVGDTGEKLATVKVEQADGTVVHIEGVYLGDPSDPAARAKVGKERDQIYRVEVQLPPAVVGELAGINQKLGVIEFLLKGLAS